MVLNITYFKKLKASESECLYRATEAYLLEEKSVYHPYLGQTKAARFPVGYIDLLLHNLLTSSKPISG